MTTDRIALLLCATFMGCTTPTDSPVAATTLPPSGDLPRVVERGTVAGHEFWRGHGGVAVGPNGALAFAISGKDADARIALVDSTGHIISSFSRTGDGPGEIRTIGSLWFDGDTLGAFDMMAQRATRFDPAGKLLDVSQIAGIGQPVGMTTNGLAVILFGENAPEFAVLTDDGSVASLIDRADPAYDSLVGAPFRALNTGAVPSIPALAIHGDIAAFADVWTDRIAWARNGRTFARFGEGTEPRFPTAAEVAAQLRSLEEWRGPDGKQMDPAAIARLAEEFPKQPVRVFDRRPGFGMAFDGKGRLWIPLEIADSVVWQVFTPGRLLGTITLPCGGGESRGRSVNGAFLAMECESPADSVPIVRVWRIEG